MNNKVMAMLSLILIVSGQVQAAAPVAPAATAAAAPAAAAAKVPTETQKKVIDDAQKAYDAAQKKFVDATAAMTAILADPAKTTAATNDGSLAKMVEASKADEKAVADALNVLNAAKAAVK